MSETVDSTAVEVGAEIVPAPAETPANLFRTNDPAEVVKRATAVADALKDVIVQKKLFTTIQGKAHITVDGWQLCGSMLGVTAVVTGTERMDNGWKATVEARTFDGRVVGAADAVCTKDEKRGPWKSADDYARLSMAQTRATSKALKGPLGFIVNLAGYASTPAEEMTFAAPDEDRPLPPNPDASWGDLTKIRILQAGLQQDIRTKLAEGMGEAGNVVLPKNAHVAPALDRLSEAQRAEIDGWLDLMEGTEPVE